MWKIVSMDILNTIVSKFLSVPSMYVCCYNDLGNKHYLLMFDYVSSKFYDKVQLWHLQAEFKYKSYRYL